MPDLFVVAGPNGTGKSTFSAALVPFDVPVFDAGKLLAERQKDFPEAEGLQLLKYIEEIDFASLKMEARQQGKDFAYETNFAGNTAFHTPHEFKDAGYRVNLVYIGLESVDMAIARVNQRVQGGGLDVSKEQIVEGYENGLLNVQKHIGSFDRALFYASGKGKELKDLKRVMELENGKIVFKNQKMPKWAEVLSVGLMVKGPEMEMGRGRKR